MKVIKLGGSLLSDPTALKQCLNHIETVQNNKQTLVIVPGGGVFADLVRSLQQQWKYNDIVAHSMALLAMQQMAWLLKSLKPSFVLVDSITEISLNHSVMIWSPSLNELNTFAIDENWDITSDSLSAWLANQVDATELILVKSAVIPSNNVDLQQMQEQGIVDNAFSQYIQKNYKITLINKYNFNEYSLIDPDI